MSNYLTEKKIFTLRDFSVTNIENIKEEEKEENRFFIDN